METPLHKGARIAGPLRDEATREFVRRYEDGESIRSIAAESGRSYGFVQKLLKEAGVQFRARGGATRPRRAARGDVTVTRSVPRS